jgi:hypothetical protein
MALEYLMSYGWAVLVVIVLGIVLYNLGLFSPTQQTLVTGFAVLKPRAVAAYSMGPNLARLVVQLTNYGGKDILIGNTTVAVSGTTCQILLEKLVDSSRSIIATDYPFWISAGQETTAYYWTYGTNCGNQAGGLNYRVSFFGYGLFRQPGGRLRHD